MTHPPEPLVFRPARGLGILSIVVSFLTATALVWVGRSLSPDSVDAMDGFFRLLFTIIPPRPFAYAGAALWFFIGLLIAQSTFGGPPTLKLASDGMELRNGLRIAWDDVVGVQKTTRDQIVIQLRNPEELISRIRGMRRTFAKMNLKRVGTPVVFSQNEVGGDLEVVVAAIKPYLRYKPMVEEPDS